MFQLTPITMELRDPRKLSKPAKRWRGNELTNPTHLAYSRNTAMCKWKTILTSRVPQHLQQVCRSVAKIAAGLVNKQSVVFERFPTWGVGAGAAPHLAHPALIAPRHGRRNPSSLPTGGLVALHPVPTLLPTLLVGLPSVKKPSPLKRATGVASPRHRPAIAAVLPGAFPVWEPRIARHCRGSPTMAARKSTQNCRKLPWRILHRHYALHPLHQNHVACSPSSRQSSERRPVRIRPVTTKGHRPLPHFR